MPPSPVLPRHPPPPAGRGSHRRGEGETALWSRRRLLGGLAALPAAPLAVATAACGLSVVTPSRPARAAGQAPLNIFAWSGYFSPALLNAFSEKTGINPVVHEYGSGAEMLYHLRAGIIPFDVIMPQADWIPSLLALGLIQPLDERRLNWDALARAFLNENASRTSLITGRRYLFPLVWGSEGVAFDTTLAAIKGATLSYADLWRPEHKGRVALRPASAFMGLGLWLESQNRLPRPLWEAFGNETALRADFEVIFRLALDLRRWTGQVWRDDASAQEAFRTDGCIVGQVWDATAAELKREKLPIRYTVPKEGGLAWLEGFAIPRTLSNREAAYQWINAFTAPEFCTLLASQTGLGVTLRQGERLLGESQRLFHQEAYPGDALDRLWWWPPQNDRFLALQNEYLERLQHG